MALTLETGANAERAAVEHLRSLGFLIVDTNWRSGRYEIDIIAEKGDTLHFVEVKCRKAGGLTRPEDAMTAAKEKFLLTAANAYIALHNVLLDCSIDLIAMDQMPDGSYDIRFIPDAVLPRW